MDQQLGFICFGIQPNPGMNLATTGTLWDLGGQGVWVTGKPLTGSLRADRCLSDGHTVFLVYIVLRGGV